MKRYLTLVFSLGMLASFLACGSGNPRPQKGTQIGSNPTKEVDQKSKGNTDPKESKEPYYDTDFPNPPLLPKQLWAKGDTQKMLDLLASIEKQKGQIKEKKEGYVRYPVASEIPTKRLRECQSGDYVRLGFTIVAQLAYPDDNVIIGTVDLEPVALVNTSTRDVISGREYAFSGVWYVATINAGGQQYLGFDAKKGSLKEKEQIREKQRHEQSEKAFELAEKATQTLDDLKKKILDSRDAELKKAKTEAEDTASKLAKEKHPINPNFTIEKRNELRKMQEEYRNEELKKLMVDVEERFKLK